MIIMSLSPPPPQLTPLIGLFCNGTFNPYFKVGGSDITGTIGPWRNPSKTPAALQAWLSKPSVGWVMTAAFCSMQAPLFCLQRLVVEQSTTNTHPSAALHALLCKPVETYPPPPPSSQWALSCITILRKIWTEALFARLKWDIWKVWTSLGAIFCWLVFYCADFFLSFVHCVVLIHFILIALHFECNK